MRATVIEIFVLIFLLTACKTKQTENKNKDKRSDRIALILNHEIIDTFYRDKRLTPDNTDFVSYRIKELTIDLNNNQKVDSIILYRIKGFENDPGDFQQIEIIMDNGINWKETNFDGWVRFDSNYQVPESIKEQNQLDTDLLCLTNFGTTKIISLFSWVYASQPGLLTIIEFSTKQPKIMLNKKFNLIELNQNKIEVSNEQDTIQIELENNNLIIAK